MDEAAGLFCHGVGASGGPGLGGAGEVLPLGSGAVQAAAAPTSFNGVIDVAEDNPVLTDGIVYQGANEAAAGGKVYIIGKSGNYKVTGTDTGPGSNRIAVVGAGVTVNLVLENVNIDVSEGKEDCAFFMGADTKVTLFLEGNNILRSVYK